MSQSVMLVTGNLLDQDVDVIVNAWNRNIIPWWLLWLQGVAGAIKRSAGPAPFRELASFGPIPLGGAVLTRAGRLPNKAIIHVAGINMWWRSSESTVRKCVDSALALAAKHGFRSIAFPLIGASTGAGSEAAVQAIIEDQVGTSDYQGRVVIVRYATRIPD